MHSNSIQNKHSDVYKNFFSKCELVFSAPVNLRWAGDFSDINQSVAITQKIPFRIYVGIQKINNLNQNNFINYKLYIPEENKFRSAYLDKNVSKKLFTYIKKEKTLNNYKIYILQEYESSRGLSVVDGLSLSLAAIISLKNGSINNKEINKYSILHDHLFYQKTDYHKKIFNFLFKAFFIRSILIENTTEGIGILSSFFQKNIFYLIAGEKHLQKATYLEKWDEKTIYDYFKNADFSIFNLNQIINLENIFNKQIEYALMYTGKIKPSFSSDKYYYDKKRDIHTKETAQILKKLKQNFYHNKINNIFSNYSNLNHNDFKNHYRKTASFLALEFLNDLYQMSHNKIEGLANFLHNLNKQNITFSLMDLDDRYKNVLMAEIITWAKKETDNLIAVKNLVNGEGGDLLIVAPAPFLKNKINKLKKHLQKKGYEHVNFTYKSWLDGPAEKGLICEQNLKENIYAKFILRNSIKVKEIDKNKSQIKIYALDNFEKQKNKADLLIDTVNNKVYLKGKLLDSKYLKTTKRTIELLKLLVDQGQIKSQELKLGSYNDRNELQSKIITPLQKAAQKFLKKKLKITISGGLISNYVINFEPQNLKIIIIKQIFG